MNKLSSQDRAALIRLASTMPTGSPERKAILAGLIKKKAAASAAGKAFSDVVKRYLRNSVPECKNCDVNLEFVGTGPTILVTDINIENIREEDSFNLLVKKIVNALKGFNVIVEATDATNFFDVDLDSPSTDVEFQVYGA